MTVLCQTIVVSGTHRPNRKCRHRIGCSDECNRVDRLATQFYHTCSTQCPDLCTGEKGVTFDREYVYLCAAHAVSSKKCPLVCFMHGLIVNQSIKFDSLPLLVLRCLFSMCCQKTKNSGCLCIRLRLKTTIAKKKVLG